MEVSTFKAEAARARIAGRSPLLRLQSDERLVALTRKGNHAAFEALVARYQTRLAGFCRHMLGSREDAEDVLQEVFAAAFNAIQADDREILVRPWLYRIARNRSLNHLRRQKPIGVDSMDVHLADQGQTTADKAHQREEFRQLIEDVQGLAETQRTALLLREMEHLSYEQIALAMDTTVPAVKSLLVRARMGLAEAAESRLLTCDEVRLELGEAAEGLKRLSSPVRRHVKDCERCGAFRDHLRDTNKALAAVFPVGGLLLFKNAILGWFGHGTGSAAGAAGAACRRRRRGRCRGRRRRHHRRRDGELGRHGRPRRPGHQGRRRPGRRRGRHGRRRRGPPRAPPRPPPGGRRRRPGRHAAARAPRAGPARRPPHRHARPGRARPRDGQARRAQAEGERRATQARADHDDPGDHHHAQAGRPRRRGSRARADPVGLGHGDAADDGHDADRRHLLDGVRAGRRVHGPALVGRAGAPVLGSAAASVVRAGARADVAGPADRGPADRRRARARHADPVIDFDDFMAVDMRVGRIVAVDEFPEARKPAWKLTVDFGEEIGTKRSSAQITNYARDELEDRLVVAVVNFPPRQIGPFMSEVLVLGAYGEQGEVLLLNPEPNAPLGSRIG